MSRHLNRAANLLLMFLGVMPQVYLVADTLRCGVDPYLPLWMALLCVCVWVAASFRRGLWVGMPLSALLLYVIYRAYDANPSAQLVDLFDRITGVYYERIYSPGVSYAFSDAVPSHALVLLLLAFLLAAYLSSSLTTRAGRVPLSLLGALPIPLACLAVNGNPSPLVILPFLLFLALLPVSGNGYSESGGGGTALFSALLPLTLLLSALLLVYDPAKYRFDEEDAARSRRFDLLSSLLADWASERTAGLDAYLPESLTQLQSEPSPPQDQRQALSGWGELGQELDMSRPFDSSALGSAVFSARSDAADLLYLRMYAYGSYNGTGWSLSPERPPSSSLAFTGSALAQAPDRELHRLDIRGAEALPYAFVPYYSARDSQADAYVLSGGEPSYGYDYCRAAGDFASLSLPESFAQRELDYRDYAHRVYTQLPDSTAETLRRLCSELGFQPGDDDLIREVAVYVQGAVRYDIHAELYASDDYAVYFLTEAESGYCVHFATAAAALYRALGIPARVTVGYLLDSVPDVYVELTGADAHAWVEVYTDGLGWLPVEVTGRSGPEDNETERPAEEPEFPEAKPSPEPKADNAPLPVGPISSTPSPAPASASAREDGGPGGKNLRRALLLALLILAVLSAPPLWYLLARKLLAERLHQTDLRKAAVAVYRASLYLQGFGHPMPEAIAVCAEKASFSEHEISPEEIQTGLTLLDGQLRALWSRLKPWQKLWIKYGKGYL